jgi:hypothetical protein
MIFQLPQLLSDAAKGLTEEKWKQLQEAGPIDIKEIYRLVYFGGMAHSLRRKLWPMLLSGSTEPEDPEKLRRDYEDRMSEWLAVEAIVRQKDRENMAMNLAKLSSEGTFAEPQPSPGILQTHESNEVRLSCEFASGRMCKLYKFFPIIQKGVRGNRRGIRKMPGSGESSGQNYCVQRGVKRD